MTSHTRHLGNLDREEVPLYQGAIDATGVDVSIRPGAYDSKHHVFEKARYSLWCSEVPVDLEAFWKVVGR